MKLFQKLLLAPAAIGLFAPIAANASEANLMDVSNYSQVDVVVNEDTFKPLSTKNPLLAGGEGLGQDLNTDFDGDVFSTTTSASFTVNNAMGAVDGLAAEEKVGYTFDWKMDLITSFDGNDSLDVSIHAGRGDGHLSELDFTQTADNALNIDSISYTRSLGDYLSVAVGDGIEGSALFSKACSYEGQTEVLSKCGNNMTGLDQEYGVAASVAIDFGSGLGLAFGYEGEGTSTDGLMTEEGADGYGFQVSYTKDNYGLSYTFVNDENSAGANHTLLGAETEYQAFNAFFTPSIDRFPSISVGFEWAKNNDSNVADTQDETTHYFIGAQFENVGNGTLGAAVGSKTPTVEDSDAETMWEAYYAYNYADGITITPVVYVKENAAVNTDDETGIILKTTFEF